MVESVFQAHASSVADLDPIACQIINLFPGNRVFALYGQMGVGKTTFVKSLCKKIGVQDVVSSPTFSIVNEYSPGDTQGVYHFDFYRINKLEEVFDMGYEEYFFSGQYCFIEWPEKIETLLPENSIRIYITEKEGLRTLRV